MKISLFIIISILLVILCSCSKDKDVTSPANLNPEAQQNSAVEESKENEKEQEELSENVVIPEHTKEELDEKFGTNEIYIVKTFMASPAEEIESYFEEGKIFTQVKHYQLSDGSWMTDEHNYKYKFELTGRLNNAVKDSTYVVLSNKDNITFDMAWKASGLSSNSEDYFKPEEAIIVAIG